MSHAHPSTHTNGVLYSTDEFSVVDDNGVKIVQPKKRYGRIIPFIQKEGVVEAVLLPKDSEGLIKYPSIGLSQLKDALDYCISREWEVSSAACIHLGFWRSHELVDDSECVWGIDCKFDENASKLIADRDLVVIPVGLIPKMGDSIAAAALLKLVVHMQHKSKA